MSQATGGLGLLRWYRPIMLGLAVIALGIALVVAELAWSRAAETGRVGADLTLYVEATRRWLSGLGFYAAHQLAGPYTVTDGDILYPPTSIILFIPFLFVPAIVFWLIPAATVGWVLLRHRPAAWTWPLMVLCIAFPPTMVKVVHGNPFMWVAMAVALGTLYGWPAVFALLKPTLAPFAFIQIPTRRWLLSAAALILVSLPFGGLWIQYVTVIVDSRNEAGVFYSMSDIPLVLVPLIAWIGRTRPTPFDAERRARAASPGRSAT